MRDVMPPNMECTIPNSHLLINVDKWHTYYKTNWQSSSGSVNYPETK